MANLASLSLALLAGVSSASTIPARHIGPESRFVSLPVQRVTSDGPIGLGRRTNTATLFNATQVTYLFELDIGSPQQKVNVVLDTGSFELWVGPTCSTASTKDQVASCQNAGSYVPSKSNTAKDMGESTQLKYGKGAVAIDYYADNIAIQGSNSSVMKDVIFGLGTASEDLTYGIAGVGHGYGFNTDYYNIVDELAINNVTNGRYFSVALASKDANNGGVVIFGGIDTKKFTGPLYKFNNLSPQTEGTSGKKGPWRYWIQMDSVGITKPGASASSAYANSAQAIVLDTGSTLSYLPKSVISSLGVDMGATQASDGTLAVPCSVQSQSGTVDFTFSGITLKVPFREFIWEISPNQCYVGVAPASSGTTALLGDSFLRSVYTVYDQDNQALYLAPYANCGQSEAAFVPGTNYTGDCSASSSGTKPNAASTSLGSPVNMWALGALAVGVQVLMSLF